MKEEADGGAQRGGKGRGAGWGRAGCWAVRLSLGAGLGAAALGVALGQGRALSVVWLSSPQPFTRAAGSLRASPPH